MRVRVPNQRGQNINLETERPVPLAGDALSVPSADPPQHRPDEHQGVPDMTLPRRTIRFSDEK